MTDISGLAAKARNRWELNVTSPYIQAYNEAHDAFKDALKAQDDANKDHAELFAAVASIMTASAIIGAIAYRPFRMLSARLGIRTLGRTNLDVVNRLYARGNSHPIVSFALGEAVDEGNDRSKAIIATLIQNTAGGVSAISPFSRREELTRLVGHQMLAIQDFATSVQDDRKRSVADREKSLAKLAQSPFLQPPHKSIMPKDFRPLIQLGMFMRLVLDTDYMMLHMPVGSRMPAQRAGGIDAMPTDRARYPRSQSGTALTSYTTVEIDRPGFKIQEAIDDAHQKVFKTPFYQQGRYLGIAQSPFGKPQELVRADKILARLSSATRPKFLTDVQFKFP